MEEVGGKAVEAIKEQVDIETDNVQKTLQDTTPVGKTGRLARSLTRTPLNQRNMYGYRLTYEGEDEYGNSYEKVANVLNSGNSKIKPKKFITKAIKKLKGLDDRAVKRFQDKLK